MGVNWVNEFDAPGEVHYGPFVIAPAACTIEGGGRVAHLDPETVTVLAILASSPGRVFCEAELKALGWPRGGEPDVARSVARLRAQLEGLAPDALQSGDGGHALAPEPEMAASSAKPVAPRRPWIPENLKPKPWHVAAVALVAVALAVPAAAILTEPVRTDPAHQSEAIVVSADEDYFHYSYARNEEAVKLYQRAIRRDPANARAHAGLANALVQRVMRWPQGDAPGAKTFTKLEDALQARLVDQPKAQSVLRRAMRMAQRAVALNPRDAAAHKALAFVNSAMRNFDDALNGYKHAVALDPDAWGPMINIGDILEIQRKTAEAVPYFEKAYVAMARVYGAQTVRVRPWHSELGIHIGDAYRARGELKQSARWYQKVLDGAPLHPAATGRLSAVLQQVGDEKTARELCAALKSRLGEAADCKS